jgi:ABC-type antimicrobial peptide transport system permease subunit
LKYNNRAEDETFSISYRGGDDQYLPTFGLSLIEGRNLLPSDTANAFLVNETFVKKLGLKSNDDILGVTISAGNEMSGRVVGVIEDFHEQSFHEEIGAVFISSNRDRYHFYAVKIDAMNISSTLASLNKAWSEMYPDKIYEYAFLDEQIAAFYKAEDTMMNLIQAFLYIAIFIGCVGLYGLVSYMTTQKTKEIGIRKVLGGSIFHVLWMFIKEFFQLIIIAFVLAAPLGWMLMNKWLQDFKYKVGIGAWIYLLAVSITAVIVLLTVGYKSFKAASVNPVKALRSE